MHSSRNTIADGLKALALLGVFMVNGLGYALAPEYPLQLGTPVPVDSVLAELFHAIALTFLMGKALPFLVFLFGYSMTHYAKRAANHTQLKRRQWKLLLIGILHGTFFYFGDILTSYALVGLWLAGSISLRARVLIASWRWYAVLGTGMVFLLLWWNWRYGSSNESIDWTNAPNVLTHTSNYADFLQLNAGSYVWGILAWVLFLAPLHLCLFLTGILAARYQWLSIKPRVPQLFFRPWLFDFLFGSWPLALLANALLAVASVHLHRQHGLQADVSWIAALNIPLGIWLVFSSLTALIRHIQTTQAIPHLLMWFAPAGRHTLAMYLGLSLTLVLCARFGLFTSASPWNHTAVWFAVFALLWFVAVCLGRAATERRMRDPISKWLSN